MNTKTAVVVVLPCLRLAKSNGHHGWNPTFTAGTPCANIPPPCGGASDWMGLSTWCLGILPLAGCDEGVLGSCHSKDAWRLLGAVATQKRVLQLTGPTI